MASTGQSGSGCAAIREIRIEGMTRYRPERFAALLDALKGECTSLSAIDETLRAITNRYVEDGFVTSRAVVGPQDLKAGTLTITVIEGQISSVEAAPGGVRYGRREIGAAFPVRRNKLLNLRALEQGVDQLARMAKGDPKIDIAPGSQPGTSSVLVKRGPQAGWIRPALTFNNDGSASTGRWQGIASLDVDSLLGRADSWSLYYQRAVGSDADHGSQAFGGFVALPQGWWTLSLSGGSSNYQSVLAGNGLVFASRGESWNASATLDRMVVRSAKTKLSVAAGLAVSDTRNFIQGIQLRTSSYRIVTARLDMHWQRRLGGSLVAVNGGYARGIGILGAYTVDAGPGGATGQFNLLSGDLALQSRFAVGSLKLSNLVALRGQWGLDNLFPAQRFSLGGTSTVRGFRDDGVSGRSGGSLREQLGFGIVDLAKSNPHLATSVSGYLGYDLGAIVPIVGEPYERGLLQSLSAGLKAQSRHLQCEVALSVPFSAPSFVHLNGALLSATIRLML